MAKNKINTRDLLLIDDNIQTILRTYYGDDSLTLVSVTRPVKDNNTTPSTESNSKKRERKGNDHFCSNIDKWTAVVKMDKEDAGTTDETLALLVKAMPNGFFHKYLSKVHKMFMREVFWYCEALPVLRDLHPDLDKLGLSPRCYHGITTFDKDFRQGFWFRQNHRLQWLFMRPDSKALLVLEDLSHPDRDPDRGGPLHVEDKKAIIDVSLAKVVMSSLAHFHGIWLTWITKREPETIGGMTADELKRIFHFNFSKNLMKEALKVHESIEQMARKMGKPDDLVNGWREFRKNGLWDSVKRCLAQPGTDSSKILTVCHGDIWLNNMMFNADKSRVTFIDFQQVQPSHPARDIWYFIYSCTDSAWRKQHVQECLTVYFDIFSKYLSDNGITMSFDEFAKEAHDRRPFGFFISSQMLPIALNPEDRDIFASLWEYREFNKWRDATFAVPPQDNDHPMIVEITRRMVDIVEEGRELGFY